MYYKVIRVSPIGGYPAISFTQEAERSIGWSKSVFGGKYLVLPATENEFRAYYRARICWNPPMRTEEKWVSATMSIDGRDSTSIIRYRPNRHQRKRSSSEILAVAERISGQFVSCSRIIW